MSLQEQQHFHSDFLAVMLDVLRLPKGQKTYMQWMQHESTTHKLSINQGHAKGNQSSLW